MKNVIELYHNQENRRSAFKMVSIFFIRGNITILSIFVVKKRKLTNFQAKDTDIYKGSRVLTVSCLDTRRATYQSILSLLISKTSKFFRSSWYKIDHILV